MSKKPVSTEAPEITEILESVEDTNEVVVVEEDESTKKGKAAEIPENTVDPMEYIPYKLPRDPRKKNDRGVYVGVNKLRLFVPYAQTVMIPRCVAEVLDHSMEQDDITANRIMDLEGKSNY